MTTLPLRLLLNAEPFGFGPSAAIAAFFPHLRSHFGTIGYLGRKHTLDLQKSLPYDAIHDVTGTPKYMRPETYAAIFAQYDILLTAMDHKVACNAQAAGLKVFYYDALAWYWPRIPVSAQKSDLYIAQDFWGVRDRLDRDFTHDAAAHIVPPIVSIPHVPSVKEHVLINLGGLQNPFWPVEEITTYARRVIDAVRLVIPSSEKIVIAASAGVAQRLNDEHVQTYSRADMERILSRSKVAFMTPGLGNIYDAAAYNMPTIWLPPANDSQGLQLRMLQKHGLADGVMDWQDVSLGIDYGADQPDILAQMARAASMLERDAGQQKALSGLAGTFYQRVAGGTESKTRELIHTFGQRRRDLSSNMPR